MMEVTVQRVTVQRGDTLWGIAARLLGDPLLWRAIYADNEQTIRESQRRPENGRDRYSGPDWIFPGTVLQLVRRQKKGEIT